MIDQYEILIWYGAEIEARPARNMTEADKVLGACVLDEETTEVIVYRNGAKVKRAYRAWDGMRIEQ